MRCYLIFPLKVGGVHEHFVFSSLLDWSLQLGLKRRERNAVKSVVVCKNEEQRYVCTGVDSCISTKLFWPEKRLRWLFEALWDTGVSRGAIAVLYG